MIPHAVLLLASILSAASIEADHPAATVRRSPDGISQVAGLSVPVPAGEDPTTAAEKFIRRYAADFGVRNEKLVPDGEPRGGRIRFAQSIRGITVSNSNLVVAFDATGNIVLVNLGRIPGPVSGRFALTAKQARARARGAFGKAGGTPQGSPVKVWYPTARSTRPAWRVDVATSKPAGAWRVFVDAQNGRVLFKEDLQATGLR